MLYYFCTLYRRGWRREEVGRKRCTVCSISFPHLVLMSACLSVFVRVSVTAVALTRQLITDITQAQPSRHAPNTLTTSVIAAPSHFPWFACSYSFSLVFQFPRPMRLFQTFSRLFQIAAAARKRFLWLLQCENIMWTLKPISVAQLLLLFVSRSYPYSDPHLLPSSPASIKLSLSEFCKYF